MDSEQFAAKWKFIKKEINKKWNKLSGVKLAEIGGEKEKLITAVEKNYGISNEEAKKEVEQWLKILQNNKLLGISELKNK